MWCVPRYSNPTGEIYAPEVVERIAAMRTAAPEVALHSMVALQTT